MEYPVLSWKLTDQIEYLPEQAEAPRAVDAGLEGPRYWPGRRECRVVGRSPRLSLRVQESFC